MHFCDGGGEGLPREGRLGYNREKMLLAGRFVPLLCENQIEVQRCV